MTPDQAPEAKDIARPIEDVEAGWKFRESLVARADADNHGAPLWHGWAIMDAFLAGIDQAKVRLDSFPRASVDATGEFKATVKDAWQNLCDKDDRSSPEDYPDHCLITSEELCGYMDDAFECANIIRTTHPATSGGETAWRDIASAPKDSSILICGGTVLYDGHTYDDWLPFKGATIAWWYTRYDGGWCSGNAEGHDEFIWHKPTHWMPVPPLPSPPQDTRPGAW